MSKKEIHKNLLNKQKLQQVVFLTFFMVIIFALFYILNIKTAIPLQPYRGYKYLSKIRSFKHKTENISKESVVEVEDFYPVIVMIDNFYESRPHAGLSQANFIYETLVEGGATRLMAIFDTNKNIKKIGPVRSARPYFVTLALEYNALYAHAGGSPEALQDIKDWQINDLNEISGYGQKYFYRDNSFPRPHNLFSDANRLHKALENRELTTPKYDHWLFSSTTSSFSDNKGKKDNFVDKIYVDFSPGKAYDAEFNYDKESNQYIRWDFNEPLRDANNGNLIKVNNIIIQKVPEEKLSGGKGRLAINILGKGKALFFKDGKVKQISWQKKSLKNKTKFLDGKSEIKLNPGITWIIIVPGNREVIY